MVKKPAPKAGSKTRPASKQTSHQGRQAKSSSLNAPAGEQAPPQDTAHQQKLLDIFQSTFASVLASERFDVLLQQVKTALFNREFDTAFGREEYLEAYAARWSPTRALCYAAVLDGIKTHLDTLCRDRNAEQERLPLQVLAIGGAAAELAAFGSYLSRRQSPGAPGSITLLDAAPWAHVVAKLQAGLTTPPALSRYASAAAHAANAALVVPERLGGVTFRQEDALGLGRDGLGALVAGPRPVLATILFTLNELFTAGGVGRAAAFLLALSSVLPAGSLLLVVDSPGSYSEATVGREAKRYPMQWLLDKILLSGFEDGAEGGGQGTWEKLEARESVWFRLTPELKYPIPLEDMRYQVHLYRRV